MAIIINGRQIDDRVQRNGSMVISKAEHGRERSKAVTTSGWSTPIRPIVLPLTTTSAHRLGKYVVSVRQPQQAQIMLPRWS